MVTWDYRGAGQSSQAAKYNLPLFAADLAAMMDALGIERAVLHGVSWGGVVVQQFALDYVERCAAIVLDSTSSEVNVAASENWYNRGEVARLGSSAKVGRVQACLLGPHGERAGGAGAGRAGEAGAPGLLRCERTGDSRPA